MQFFELLGAVYAERRVGMGADVIRWVGEAGRSFSVSSFYRHLMGDGVVDGLHFSWRNVWVVGVPTKISFFVWTVALGGVLTMDNLIRRQYVLVN